MSETKALPTFIIVGAMKCATSSLHFYLNQHPDISMSMPKELNFFISNSDNLEDGEVADKNFERGVDWYKAHFDASCTARGESSPAYMDPRHHGVAARMAKLVPDALLLVLTRDPFERAVSEFHHRVATGEESRPMEVALLDLTSSYVHLSRYHSCLEPFFAAFPRGALIRYRQEDLDSRTPEVLDSIISRLGVDRSYQFKNLDTRINTAAGRGLLNRLLLAGEGTKVRKLLARVIPIKWKYALDARSRQSTRTSAPETASTAPSTLREQFLRLVEDDARALLADIESGRLIEGLPAGHSFRNLELPQPRQGFRLILREKRHGDGRFGDPKDLLA